ncbi:hypothetical protein N9N67_08245 [Bacteriovoracaceae bacterium]|nr:hypothetical protein [Bacteriovoracaceae bacterium]
MAHLKLNYNQLSQAVDFVQTKIVPGQIQKIYSTAGYIIFRIRAKKQSLNLFIGKGYGHESLWLNDKLPPPETRIYDSFVGFLRKHFQNLYIDSLYCDQNDRIILFSIMNNYKSYILALGYIGRQCKYYIVEKDEGLLASNFLFNKDFNQDLSFENFNSIGRKELRKDSSKTFLNADQQEAFYAYLDKNYKKVLSKTSKKLNRKINFANSDLIKLETYVDLFDLAKKSDDELVKLPEKMVLNNVKIKFKSNISHHRRDYLFNRGKRLREVIGQTKERILKLESDLKNIKQKFDFISPKKIVLAIRPEASKEAEQLVKKTTIDQNKNFLETNEEFGKIYYGLTSKGNDIIRREFSTKNDYWFHFEKETGPHAILKLDNKHSLLPDVINLIGKKLVEIKGIEVDRITLIYTQVKNIRAVKGQEGKVTYKNIKSLMVFL